MINRRKAGTEQLQSIESCYKISKSKTKKDIVFFSLLLLFDQRKSEKIVVIKLFWKYQ